MRLVIALVLSTGCLGHPCEERFGDDVGVLTHDGVDVAIRYGTAKVIDDRIESRAQTPNVDIQMHSTVDRDVTLEFVLNNVRTTDLPVLSPARGTLSPGATPKTVTYTVTLSPREQLTVSIDSFPPTGDYRFGVVGDIQSDEEAGAWIAADASLRDLDFFVVVGDLMMRDTLEEQRWGLALMDSFAVPTYLVVGNHELDLVPNAFDRFRRRYGRANLEFRHRQDLFLILDSAGQSVCRSVLDYAERVLEQNDAERTFVLLHVPPFDECGMRNNSFGTRYHAARFQDLLRDASVDLVFSGHIHTYQDFEVAGVRNIVVGTGGGIPERLDGVGHRYVIVERSGDAVTVQPVDRPE
jgi:Icc-related predicted phosphoesterase